MLDPRIVTTIGLGLDIVGIVLLFRFGGIGSSWIHEDPLGRPLDGARPDHPILRKERLARRVSGLGLFLATVGFLLQIWAQWL